jgi:hypothetical protein
MAQVTSVGTEALVHRGTRAAADSTDAVVREAVVARPIGTLDVAVGLAGVGQREAGARDAPPRRAVVLAAVAPRDDAVVCARVRERHAPVRGLVAHEPLRALRVRIATRATRLRFQVRMRTGHTGQRPGHSRGKNTGSWPSAGASPKRPPSQPPLRRSADRPPRSVPCSPAAASRSRARVGRLCGDETHERASNHERYTGIELRRVMGASSYQPPRTNKLPGRPRDAVSQRSLPAGFAARLGIGAARAGAGFGACGQAPVLVPVGTCDRHARIPRVIDALPAVCQERAGQ